MSRPPLTTEQKARLWDAMETMAKTSPCARVGIIYFDETQAECFCGCRHHDETNLESAVMIMLDMEGLK